MSFSRAPLKRFNETIGCAPPPGTYDIKPGDLKGAASFDKSDRFKHPTAGAVLQPPPSPSRSVLSTPVRRAMSVDVLDQSSAREKTGMDRKNQKLLEKEIRSLVQQRGEQDRQLQALGEELKKVEAELLASVREKTGLAANVTTLERQRVELKKINDFLKNKVSADATKKRINSLTMELMEARNNLDVKSKELSVLQVNSEGQLKVLDSDLQAARNTVTSLKERNANLEDLHHALKSQNTELETENARLQAVICELKEELKVVQGYLDAANDEIQDLRLQIQGNMEKVAAGSQEKVKDLQAELEQRATELESVRDGLRQKEEELESSQKTLKISEDKMIAANEKIHECEATIHQQEAELLRLRDVLRRTEKELDERVAHLEQRCVFSEVERSKTQEEGLRRVSQLKDELSTLSEERSDTLKKLIFFKQENRRLEEEVAKRKELAESLSVLVQHEREEAEKQVKLLKDEIEEILGELAVMEEQEERKQEDILKLQEHNKDLERQLSDTRALLDSKHTEVAALRNEHSAAIKELREAHTNSLGEMGDIVAELERTKEALKAAQRRESELEAEVGRVSRQMKEEMDKMVEQKEEEIRRVQEVLEEHQESQLAEAKGRELNTRMLLEVQTLLAQRDEEIKATEVSHAIQVNQLQQELQLQTKEREEALGQLEEQLGRIRSDWENAQELLQEVSREREEVTEQLRQERLDRAKIQEEKEALEVERTEQQQVRSEVIRLQAELERAEEEKSALLSQAEAKDKSTRTLESLLSTCEQDRNRLQSRLREVEQEAACLQAQADFREEKVLALREQAEVLTQEKVTLQWEMEEQREELQRQITEAQEKSSSDSEREHWKDLYEKLFAKVQPFQEQLNAFAAQRDALLNENGTNQEELNKLADAYAHLLGHQNQKQKIKHVMKLKDENIALKQEVSKLRSQVTRQKSDLEQMKSKLPDAPRRRFDPSKAFQHNKENQAV